jgi:hypothetical protein
MNEEVSKLNNINDFFKLPIYYNSEKVELKKNIINDLELITAIDQSSNPIYSYYFNNDNDISKKIAEQTATYYTTDISFLKDTQQLLSEYKNLPNKYTDFSPNYKNIMEIWNELKIDSGFKEKYYYVDWQMLEFLNNSSLFLQFMSIYNLLSPVLSLFMPIMILIIPFIILKAKGIKIDMQEYMQVLCIISQQNAIGKIFTTNFSEINLNEKLYIIISAAFYLFSIYQNIMVCVRFNNNMLTIHKHFREINTYLNSTISNMENYFSTSKQLATYTDFNTNLREKIDTLKKIRNKISNISEYTIYNVNKLTEIGNILKYFYELHNDKIYDSAIMYSFGFNGYIDCIEGLMNNIKERKINSTMFINDNKKTIINNSYYACLKDNNPIKNTIKLKKNIIITGPNASGKTTILKSTLINIIFSQQFGYGFYDSAKISPFKHIHCYLNIPDTSGRDSLFQAEARRCKEILDIVCINNKETHFCIFDELYSGTNPEEAISSATAFMKYLIKNKNVSCLLTTHFVKVCKILHKNKDIINCCMITKHINNKLNYTYKLDKGISNVKGGINVLTDLNYPSEIINNTKKNGNKQN